ncbi:neuropeptide FF receptor 1 like 2 isoform X2 [Oreochromis niloticus]|uniref:neuropeptide FF receptor 1 like 2 isoform X2 n=1 Tax=Oreochromis niloticus TaxID=8128 RepID=UPI000DF196AD|nr:neuropeptide FF receptor 1-like isoform X2 [Oreochromis niloticus]
MDILDVVDEDGMAFEGSIITSVLLNTSLLGVSNVTNITFFPYYQHSLYVAAIYTLAYSFIFLLCMVGNILVCLIVLENRRMRTVTNLFILNLAISDLLVGIFCIPTTLVDNLITGWPFSNTVCKMSGFVQGVSVSASVFTLVAIAVERFRCIVYPLQPKLTVFIAKLAIISIWVLAVAFMCPAAVALTVEKVPYHYMIYNNNFNHSLPLYTCYENFANPRMRKEPHLANATVQVGSRRHGHPRVSRKKIKVIKMLIVVALLFMLSWLPLWTLMMITDYADLDGNQLDLLTSYIFPFAHWLAFSNSSVNPIIYGYYNENFKRGFEAICKSRPFCCLVQSQLWSRIVGWRKKRRSVQAPCEGTVSREVVNHNHFVLGLRNRVHNDNKLNDTAEVNRSARVECAVVHSGRALSDQELEMTAVNKKSSNEEESEKVSSLAVSPYQVWDN